MLSSGAIFNNYVCLDGCPGEAVLEGERTDGQMDAVEIGLGEVVMAGRALLKPGG